MKLRAFLDRVEDGLDEIDEIETITERRDGFIVEMKDETVFKIVVTQQ